MGGSFSGYELAEGLGLRKNAKCAWVMAGPWFLRYVLDEEGGQLCRQMGEAQDVEFIVEDEVKKFSRTNGRFHAETVNGKHVDFDLLTYGVGLDYYTEPVRGTGIELNKGIVTDAKLRTQAPDVYAAAVGGGFFHTKVDRPYLYAHPANHEATA